MTVTIAISPPSPGLHIIAVAEGTTFTFSVTITATAASSAQAWSLDADVLFARGFPRPGPTDIRFEGFPLEGSVPAGQTMTLTEEVTLVVAEDTVFDPSESFNIRFEVAGGRLAAGTTSEYGFNIVDTAEPQLGTAGPDQFDGTRLGDFYDGQDGADSISGGSGNDRLRGGAGDDALFGGEGRDTLEGGSGNDILTVESNGIPYSPGT